MAHLLTRAAGLAAAPAPDARRAVGQMSAVLLLLALIGLVVLCTAILVYLRRRARMRARLAAARELPPERPDAWVEASRRVPLEEDGAIPREPGTE
ncbi:MAG TPA: hypothetical protein VFF69_09485 [Phycisphaerales bacterium]|nr:hypothetical protein [Phycisphaerales bacterium]